MGFEAPAIMAIGALAASAIGTGVSVYSNIQQGKAAKAAANAQAMQLEDQAKVAEAQASIAQLQGEKEAERRFAILSQDIGSTYAAFAGNGLSLDSGSVSKALSYQVSEATADVNSIRDKTMMDVWSSMNNAQSLLNQASLARYQGKSASSSANLSAVGTGISGIGDAMMAGYSGYNMGTKFSDWWNS